MRSDCPTIKIEEIIGLEVEVGIGLASLGDQMDRCLLKEGLRPLLLGWIRAGTAGSAGTVPEAIYALGQQGAGGAWVSGTMKMSALTIRLLASRLLGRGSDLLAGITGSEAGAAAGALTISSAKVGMTAVEALNQRCRVGRRMRRRRKRRKKRGRIFK